MRPASIFRLLAITAVVTGFLLVMTDSHNVAMSRFVDDWSGMIGDIIQSKEAEETALAQKQFAQVSNKPDIKTTPPASKPEQSQIGPLPAAGQTEPAAAENSAAAKSGVQETVKNVPSGQAPSEVLPSTEDARSDENPQAEINQVPASETVKKLLAYEVSADDLKNTKLAFAHIGKDRFTTAKKVRSQIKDPYCQKLVDWYGLRNVWKPTSKTQIIDYVNSNGDWPGKSDFRRRVELDLLNSDSSAAEIKSYLKDEKPEGGIGKLLLAKVRMSEGNKDEAHDLIRSVWRDHDFSKRTEDLILKRYGSLLRTEDHHHRSHRLLYTQRKSNISAARRAAKFLDKAEQKKIDARIAQVRRTRSSGKLLSALPEDARVSPEILFSRIRWHRRKKNYVTAWKLLAEAPNDESLISPDHWWKEARYHVREALNKRNAKIAYKIASNHGNPSVNYLNQAEFMAGWIALRFLKKPEQAKEHFIALSKSADGPRSKSRAQYWLGRTSLVLGDDAQAKIHFSKGADFFNTFYGQLSRQALDINLTSIEVSPTPVPTTDEVSRFMNRDAVRALIVAHKADLRGTVRKFFVSLRYSIEDPGEFVLLGELAKQIGETQQGVRIGKLAMFYGHDLAEYAYPTHAIPEFKPLRKLPEWPIIFGITRQESEFNTEIISHAGARGLMQVMPITARHVARDHKIKYQRQRLIKDPAYNAKIGSAYIAGRLDEFSGSYIMTFAGFNAGPGRVRQWVRLFGDPRSKSIDPIDWIERIPFNETRNYVKKVLANVQVYRSLLGKSEKPLRIAHDLNRGRRGAPSLHGLMQAGN